jgi:hypothetical protein
MSISNKNGITVDNPQVKITSTDVQISFKVIGEITNELIDRLRSLKLPEEFHFGGYDANSFFFSRPINQINGERREYVKCPSHIQLEMAEIARLVREVISSISE